MNKPKIGILGHGHLGQVMTAALHHWDFDVQVLPTVNPDFMLHVIKEEPKLSSFLRYLAPDTSAPIDLIWVTMDVPIATDGNGQEILVYKEILNLKRTCPGNIPLIISSQVPVGFCRIVRKAMNVPVCYAPENLRRGKSMDYILNPDRLVVGCDEEDKDVFRDFFDGLPVQKLWMGLESAEMTKHAINTFMSLSIVFANELGRFCDATGASKDDVERGLRSEARIGPKAYLHPGGPITGGTLLRDVNVMIKIAQKIGYPPDLLESILSSNSRHMLEVQAGE